MAIRSLSDAPDTCGTGACLENGRRGLLFEQGVDWWPVGDGSVTGLAGRSMTCDGDAVDMSG